MASGLRRKVTWALVPAGTSRWFWTRYQIVLFGQDPRCQYDEWYVRLASTTVGSGLGRCRDWPTHFDSECILPNSPFWV